MRQAPSESQPSTGRFAGAVSRLYRGLSERPHWTRFLRRLLVAGVIVYLGIRLSQIGWAEVFASLPTTPLYYALVLVAYAVLPVTDSLIFRRFWSLPFVTILRPILHKRVLNSDVLGYSGDLYLFAWATDRLPLPKREIAYGIKDNLILSSFASIGTAAVVLSVFLATDQILVTDFIDQPAALALGGAVVAVVGGAAIYFRLHRVLFHLPSHLIAWSASLNTSRYLIGFAVAVCMWAVVVPDAPFRSWATLLAFMVLVNRIPVIPSRDLLFAGIGIELSTVINVPGATIASLLLVRSAIDRVLNAVLFLWASREPVMLLPDQLPADDPAETATSEDGGANTPDGQ